MIEYETRVIETAVLPKGREIFDENGYRVLVDDEAGGEFVVLREQLVQGANPGEVRLDKEAWPQLRAALDSAFASLVEHDT